jgi:O-antigen/teichoic acid export membrane protein
LATGIAAATNLAANAYLIPRFGMLGAAWANAMSYATLAAITVWLSWREYSIPYEWRRLSAVAAAGIGAYLAAEFAGGRSAVPLVSAVLRGLVTVAVFATILLATGFLHSGELRVLNDMRRRAVRGSVPPPSSRDESEQTEMAGEIVATTHEPGEKR